MPDINGGGVRGGKETDQGECQAVVNGPDSEPGRQVAWTVWRTNHETPESVRLDQGGTLFVIIQGKSRMRSFRTYGSVRGVARKGHS